MEKITKTELKKLVKIARESCPALEEREDKDALIEAYNLGKKAMKEEN